MKKDKGILLLELLITISLLMFVVPTIYFSYLFLEKTILNNVYNMTKQDEYMAIRYFIRQDIKKLKQVNKIWNLEGINVENDIISYACKDNFLKRSIKSGVKKAQISNLNGLLKIYEIRCIKRNHLLVIDLKTDIGDKQIAIFLPNE